MTKILYNRAAKTFMDAISEGFDEHGAYDKVEKKHGKVLADAVWAEAQAEMKAMKKNPRKTMGIEGIAKAMDKSNYSKKKIATFLMIRMSRKKIQEIAKELKLYEED